MDMYWLVERSRSAPAGVRKEACEKTMGIEMLR